MGHKMAKNISIIAYIVLFGFLCCTQINANDVFSFSRSNDEILDKNFDGMCPNNRTRCSPTQTCCKTKHHSYHCCKYRHAVCCPDLFHCCPHGTTCNTRTKRCNRNVNNDIDLSEKYLEDPMEWKVENDNEKNVQKMMKLSKSQNLVAENLDLENVHVKSLNSDITCPNNKTKCKDTKTCCITKHGNYYCCPHKNAVCCSDKWTCCAEGSTCDVKNKKCNNPTISTEVQQSKAKRLEETSDLIPLKTMGSVIEQFLGLFSTVNKRCGNTNLNCPGEKKCCPMENNKFGCCKFRKAVCCPDFATCCPHGTTCDIKQKICTAPAESLVPVTSSLKDNVLIDLCPDNRTQCSPGETCCSVGKVLYGCCPMKNATCCSNKQSCCPHNKKCDIKHNRCVKMDENVMEETSEIITYEVSLRKPLEIFLSNVGLKTICPDHGKCPGSYTCCKTTAGTYGCCPYTSATCCPNRTTCCPHNKRCSKNRCV